MRVTLARTPCSGDMKPDPAIYCNQVRLPIVDRLEHQPSHETLDTQFILPTECAGVEQNLREGPTNDWPSLRPMLWEGSHCWQPLMIFCYTHLGLYKYCQKGFTQQLLEAGAKTHSQTWNKAYGILWELEGSRTPQENLESTNLGPWRLMKTELPTIEHERDRPGLSAYM